MAPYRRQPQELPVRVEPLVMPKMAWLAPLMALSPAKKAG